MQRDERHFSVDVDELFSAPVPAAAGWVPTMDIRYVDQEHEVRPGSVEMVPAGMPHWLRNTGDEPLVIVGGSLGPLTDAIRQVRPPRPGPGPR
jgi:hypothetical protein